MTYTVKELFYTLQGEGANAGRPAVFCRFTGCNLWSGREADRVTAQCTFCDTDFVGIDGPGGGKFRTAQELTQAASALWPQGQGNRFIVFTGGEPMLQLNTPLIAAMHAAGFIIAVESNGTLEPVPGIDWLCVSPKADTQLKALAGDELKLVYPQEKAMPERFEGLAFTHFFLQPMDGPEREANTQAAIEYCKAHPKWRLSVQTHKMLGIP
jgi:7-carboxy-7-deazaguanine synthase (Cx14CxxC type)